RWASGDPARSRRTCPQAHRRIPQPLSRREDVYAHRWERGENSGYSPAAAKDWKAIQRSRPEDRKRVDRETRRFFPMTDAVIESHLLGEETVAYTRCCRTRPAGFLRRILTRKRGNTTPWRFSNRVRNWTSPRIASALVRAKEVTSGSFSTGRFLRSPPGSWDAQSSRAPWSAGTRLAWIRMIASSRTRTRCRKAASGT